MAIRTRPCDDKDTSLFDGIHMYLGNNAIAIPRNFCREVWKVLQRSFTDLTWEYGNNGFVRQKRFPPCQPHLGSLHAGQSVASSKADTNSFHIFLCFYLAIIRIKADNSMSLEPFSLRITDILVLFHIFCSYTMICLHHLMH